MSILAAGGSVLLTALIVVAASAGQPVLAAAVAFVVLTLAVGWPTLLGVAQAHRTTAAVVMVSGLAATALASLTATRVQPLAGVSVLLAGCVLLAFAHQLLRRDGRDALVESITVTLSGQVIAVLAAGWVLLVETRVGRDGLLVAAVAVAVPVVVLALPIDSNLRAWVAFASGASVATVVSVVVATSGLAATVLVGVAVAAVGAGTGMLLQSQPRASQTLGALAAAAGPVSAVGTVAYAVARLTGG